jgi:SAM-dependent methyltransferase
MSRLLNFGCGSVFHAAWVNLDAVPATPDVMPHDLRRPFPFPDGSFDGAYGSHVLEHLDPSAAARLLRECHRILKPAGIIRVVVPDLEAIVRLYLQCLERAAAGDPRAERRYDWMMLELYDQAVRTSSGGAMGACLRGALDKEQAEFIASRIGAEAQAAPQVPRPRPAALLRAVAVLRRRAAGLGAWLFLGTEGREALREGLFRRSGEVHQWMYDGFSVRRALRQAGFADARVCAADESAIPGFAGYGLETLDGRPRKPDSLYVEARRPDKG